MNIAEHDTLSGRQLSEQIKQNAIEQAKDGNPMFGRSRGILSGLVNSVSSGSIVVSAVAAVTSITGSEKSGNSFSDPHRRTGIFPVLVFNTKYIPSNYEADFSGRHELRTE